MYSVKTKNKEKKQNNNFESDSLVCDWLKGEIKCFYDLTLSRKMSLHFPFQSLLVTLGGERKKGEDVEEGGQLLQIYR